MRFGQNQIEHPSFGRVVITKAQGGQRRLFGSEVEHTNTVEIAVEHAKIEQDIHGDWIFGKERIVEFSMSEAQWAHMLSSFGDGSGTPVTLSWTEQSGPIEQPPKLPSIVDVQRIAVDSEVKGLADRMQDIQTKFNAMLKGATIKKSDVKGLERDIDVLRSFLVSNLPYFERATIERMEKEVSKAKIEVEAIINNAVHRAGLQAIAEGHVRPVLVLPDGGEA